MRIVEKSGARLVMEDRPWSLAVWLWTMGLGALSAVLLGQLDGAVESVLVGLLGLAATGVAWYFFPFQRITFDRESGTMTRRIARVSGATEVALPLGGIRRAASQGSFSDGGTRLERIALLTDDGPYPLEFGFGSAPRGALIREINEWLGA